MPSNFHFTIQKDLQCSLHLYANKLQLEPKEQLAKAQRKLSFIFVGQSTWVFFQLFLLQLIPKSQILMHHGFFKQPCKFGGA
jgi:hypothetical protein